MQKKSLQVLQDAVFNLPILQQKVIDSVNLKHNSDHYCYYNYTLTAQIVQHSHQKWFEK